MATQESAALFDFDELDQQAEKQERARRKAAAEKRLEQLQADKSCDLPQLVGKSERAKEQQRAAITDEKSLTSTRKPKEAKPPAELRPSIPLAKETQSWQLQQKDGVDLAEENKSAAAPDENKKAPQCGKCKQIRSSVDIRLLADAFEWQCDDCYKDKSAEDLQPPSALVTQDMVSEVELQTQDPQAQQRTDWTAAEAVKPVDESQSSTGRQEDELSIERQAHQESDSTAAEEVRPVEESQSSTGRQEDELSIERQEAQRRRWAFWMHKVWLEAYRKYWDAAGEVTAVDEPQSSTGRQEVVLSIDRQARHPEFHDKSRVRLQGLKTATYNGKTGVLDGYCADVERWLLRLDDGTTIKVKERNMVEEATPGTYAVIRNGVGVNTRMDFTGKRIAVLSKGANVEVLEIAARTCHGFERARIAYPDGWISTKLMDGSEYYVVKAKEEARLKTVEQTRPRQEMRSIADKDKQRTAAKEAGLKVGEEATTKAKADDLPDKDVAKAERDRLAAVEAKTARLAARAAAKAEQQRLAAERSARAAAAMELKSHRHAAETMENAMAEADPPTSEAAYPVSATTSDTGNWHGYPTTNAYRIDHNSFVFVTHLGASIRMVMVDRTGQDIQSKYRAANAINVLNRDEVIQAWKEGKQLLFGSYIYSLESMQFSDGTQGDVDSGDDIQPADANEGYPWSYTDDAHYEGNEDPDCYWQEGWDEESGNYLYNPSSQTDAWLEDASYADELHPWNSTDDAHYEGNEDPDGYWQEGWGEESGNYFYNPSTETDAWLEDASYADEVYPSNSTDNAHYEENEDPNRYWQEGWDEASGHYF